MNQENHLEVHILNILDSYEDMNKRMIYPKGGPIIPTGFRS